MKKLILALVLFATPVWAQTPTPTPTATPTAAPAWVDENASARITAEYDQDFTMDFESYSAGDSSPPHQDLRGCGGHTTATLTGSGTKAVLYDCPSSTASRSSCTSLATLEVGAVATKPVTFSKGFAMLRVLTAASGGTVTISCEGAKNQYYDTSAWVPAYPVPQAGSPVALTLGGVEVSTDMNEIEVTNDTNDAFTESGDKMTIDVAQIAGLANEVNDLSDVVTWANVPDANVNGAAESDEIDDDVMPFDDADNNWTATTIGPALEELDNVINGGLPNDATGKVDWSQLTNVPAGFADGSDNTGGGSAIILDLGDDAGNDSTDLEEIATVNDTHGIVTMPVANKMLIDMSNNWPAADTATEVAAGGFANATDLDANGALNTDSVGLGELNPCPGESTATIVEYSATAGVPSCKESIQTTISTPVEGDSMRWTDGPPANWINLPVRDECNITWQTPEDTDDVLCGMATGDLNLIQLDCVITGATDPGTVNVAVYECDGNAANCVASGGSASVLNLNETITDSTFATDAVIDAGNWWGIFVTSTSGAAADFLHCQVEFSRVD